MLEMMNIKKYWYVVPKKIKIKKNSNTTKGPVTRKQHEIHTGMKKNYVTRVFHFEVKLMPA